MLRGLSGRAAHEGAVKCVVKPRTGCGSEGVYVSEGPVEKDGFISTEYIDGEHLSVSLVSGSGFVLPLTLNRQHIHMNEFITYDGNDVNIDHHAKDEIFSVARRAGIMLGCRGLFGVDIVYADQPYIVDVNPRPTTAMVGVARVIDRNLADLILLARFGELPDRVGYRVGARSLKRTWGRSSKPGHRHRGRQHQGSDLRRQVRRGRLPASVAGR